MLVVIDNYDSFTYNLVQYFLELGVEVQVYRNDQLSVAQIAALNPTHLVISPGPCTPNEAGISLQAIRSLAGQLPILGVCLGHQCIAQAYGGRVIRASHVMHGKTSIVHHANQGVFVNLPNPIKATRYHSLVVEPDSVPDCLEVTSWVQHQEGGADVIMGIKHRTLALEGVQFHPESILTEAGHQLLANFVSQQV